MAGCNFTYLPLKISQSLAVGARLECPDPDCSPAAVAVLAGCATSQLHSEGLADVQEGRYEEGLKKLEEAAASSPGNAMYRLDLKAKHEEAILTLIAAADRRARPAHSTRRRLLPPCAGIEAGNERALRGLELLERDRRHGGIMTQAQRDFDQGRLDEADARVRTVLAENPGFGRAIGCAPRSTRRAARAMSRRA